jgi:sugar lactone lactonase YvrE
MRLIRSILGHTTFLLLLLAATATRTEAQQCSGRLLASGYFSTVHIYDVCTGEFLRTLDDNTRIRGPQAIKLGPDGLIWVVSEEAGTILRYRADTYEYVDTFATVGAPFGATGIAFDGNGQVYVSSYSLSTVRRYVIETRTVNRTITLGANAVGGPDNGLMIAPDGNLYIPGYDTSNVGRYDPASGSLAANYIAPRAGGLRHTRGLLTSPDGSKLYVTSEGSGDILRFTTSSGALERTIATGLVSPTGIAWHPDGSLLVAHASSKVLKLDPETGAVRGTLIDTTGGLSGVTYLAVLPAGGGGTTTPDPATIGSQYWLGGLATMNGNTVDIPDGYVSLGTAFGSAFNASQVQRVRWGRLRVQFTSCTEAEFSWESTGAGTANFGNGGYRISRILRNAATTQCEATGIAGAPNKLWLAGAWYGGESRSGEGLMLDVDSNNQVFLVWFTHRPVMN